MSDSEEPAKKPSLETTVDNLSRQVSQLAVSVGAVLGRLDSIEEKAAQARNSPDCYLPSSSRHATLSVQHGRSMAQISAADQFAGNTAREVPSVDADGLAQDFDQLKRSVERVQIDKRLTFSRDKTGIKREDQRAYNVIAKCATFAETVVKLTQNLDPPDVSEEILNNIFLCAVAQLGYLREESASLFVKGEYGNTTARLYRHLQKHTTLNPESVETLRSAVQLAAFHETQPNTGRGRGRGGNNWRGGNFGQQQRGYRGDSYSKFTGRSVGFKRPDPNSQQPNDGDTFD